MYQIAVDGFNGQEGDIVLSWFVDPTQDPLPVIVEQPKSVITTPSNNVSFVVEVAGTLARFQWFFEEQPLPGQTEPVLNLFNVQADAAGAYFVRVFQGNSFVDSRPALLQFSLTEPGAVPPTNFAADKFADAVAPTGFPAPLGEGARILPASVVVGYAGTQVFSTYGAVSEPGEPVHCGVVGGASVWYTYTAPDNGTVYMNTEGSDFDTILAVYTGPGTSFSTLVPVACDNNSGRDGRTSKLSFAATVGTTYAIAVDGVNGASGWVNLNYRLLVPMVISRVAGTNETFRFRLTATPNFPFTIQRSQDLINWTNVLTTNTSTGNFTFFESNITARVQRFFRAVQTP
jgi:enamine deaminase RidA (YjgF/YER057c/UK114 family)